MLSLTIAVTVIAVTWWVKGYQAAVDLSGLVGLVLTFPPLVVRLVVWQRSARVAVPLGMAEVRGAKDVLAGVVAEQWKVEATIRALGKPDPMPVQWRLTSGAMDQLINVAPDTLPLAGSSSQIAGFAVQFRELRRRRLVIVGERGTGKTTLAVQLLRELLATRAGREHEPVPVLLSVASWDTREFPTFQDWLAMRLGQDYPALRAPQFGTDLPKTLAVRGQILPVLDGLDELPNTARAAVINALNHSLGEEDQLILTSRTTEFFQAVREAGQPLSSAAVIEPQPLTPVAAADYLRRCLPHDPNPGWEQVLTSLETPALDGGTTALADTVSTALGLWLLRTTYTSPDENPAPLLKSARFPTAQSLRAHMFDRLIPTLIKDRPPSDDPTELFRPRQRHDPDKVRNWLGYLAYHLNQIPTDDGQTGTHNFAWWQLARYALPPHTLKRQVRLAAGLTNALMTGLAGGLVYGLAAGLVYGLADGLEAGLMNGLMCALILGRAASSWPKQAPGFVKLHLAGRTTSRIRPLKSQFAAGGALGLLAGLVNGLNFGPVFGIVTGLAAGLVFGLVFALAAWLVESAETPTPTDQANTPLTTWRNDRSLNIVRTATTGLAFGLVVGLLAGFLGVRMAGLAGGLTGGVIMGLVGGLDFGLIAGRHHAWLAYLVATHRLARHHQLPRHLMPFLDDAHRLGLLRTIGPFYQFRHAELQDHLVEKYRSCEGQRTSAHMTT